MPPEASDLTPQDLADAREAAEQLLQAVQRGDEAAARARLIPPGQGESMDFNSMHESTSSYELGEPQADGAVVVVEAKVYGAVPEGGGEPPLQTLPLVLRQADGAWKVDMGASIQRMLGFDLGDVMTQMVEGLGNAMAKGMEAVAEGFSALSSPQGEEEGFREAIEYARQTVLPDEVAAMTEALGKPLDVVVAWHSLRGSADAARRLGPLALGRLSEAVRMATANPEVRERLQSALDRVVVRHVTRPNEKLCILDGGQLELAVCLVDSPGEEDSQGLCTADEIAEVLKRAIE